MIFLPMSKQRSLKVAVGIFVIALPAAALLNVALTHHAFLVLSHYLGGRAGNCSVAESFEGDSLSTLQSANAVALRRASRVVRRDDSFSLYSTPLGEYWIPTASGDAVIYDLAEQERNIYGTRIHSGDIVLDAGANVGVFTRKALMAGAARVVAIEPAPENLRCLQRTFASEIAEGRVVLYPKGIWDKDDVLKLGVDPANSARDSFVRGIDNAQFIEAPLTTVDKMVEELRLPRVDFIKMDIEGAEQKAVAGARKTIARFRPRMALSIYHLKDDATAVVGLVHATVADYTVTRTCLCASDGITPEVAFFF